VPLAERHRRRATLHRALVPSRSRTRQEFGSSPGDDYESRWRDLAFLRVRTDVPPLRLAERHEFKRGQSITVIGSPGVGPLVMENAVTQGVLSTQTQIEGQDYYQSSISINPGNSGGPVFDKFGEVIGVVRLKATQQEGIAFCVPLKDLREGIAQAEAQKPGG
jgi:S1-C subfamily serine protease